MNRILFFLAIIIFSIFLGSQITEGFLLVPYWQSLSTQEFYKYYSKFGPLIGKFYTILTIIAVLIPISISVFCFLNKRTALKYSIVSSFFALLIIAIFYTYFKGTNQQFYEASFDAYQLKSTLKNWNFMHWLRVLFETISLVFLIITMKVIDKEETKVT
ncbi:hypothetical protein [Aurantibacter sp.]|uniref:hypothetical protein n=1 Tax=Aurantibacter sp. TaxID=2807103 RepID=UPI0032645FD2